jgi:hypothetical protein
VERDHVALLRDPRRQLGVPFDLLTDEKEHRARVCAREDVEHSGCAFRVRAIVERQRHSPGAGERSRDPD